MNVRLNRVRMYNPMQTCFYSVMGLQRTRLTYLVAFTVLQCKPELYWQLPVSSRSSCWLRVMCQPHTYLIRKAIRSWRCLVLVRLIVVKADRIASKIMLRNRLFVGSVTNLDTLWRSVNLLHEICNLSSTIIMLWHQRRKPPYQVSPTSEFAGYLGKRISRSIASELTRLQEMYQLLWIDQYGTILPNTNKKRSEV